MSEDRTVWPEDTTCRNCGHPLSEHKHDKKLGTYPCTHGHWPGFRGCRCMAFLGRAPRRF